MRKANVVGSFALLVLVSCDDAVQPETGILERLARLQGVEVTEIEPHHGYPRAFQLDIEQPVDHDSPGGERFSQRAYLSHVDEAMTMVFAPNGYSVGPTTGQELAGILRTNCLSVTHRYFDGAEPESMDWQFLTIRQSAADHHRIVELFKEIYTGVWVSTGASKGGKTALIHKRFYPTDVEAVVSYVAPIMFGTADPRFIDYLASVGDAECRDRVHQFQRRLLVERDSLVPRFSQWFVDNGLQLTRDPDEAYESAVRSYDWNFWQYRSDECESIPGPDVSFDEMLAHFDHVRRFSRIADEGREYYRPYGYQALTETGYPARSYEQISDLLLYEPANTTVEYFESIGVDLIFRPEAMIDINHWLQVWGDNVVYIYGADDPWTAGAVELIGRTNALKVTQPRADHGVTIADLDQEQLVHATLQEWLGLDVPALVQYLISVSRRDPDLTLQVGF